MICSCFNISRVTKSPWLLRYANWPLPIAFKEATAAASLAERRALRKLGTAMEARIKITPTTTRSSISENPLADDFSRIDCRDDMIGSTDTCLLPALPGYLLTFRQSP